MFYHPILGQKVARATVSLYMRGTCTCCQYIQVHSTTPAANSHYGDFSDGICCVVKITAAESKPDMETLNAIYILL